MKRIATVFLVSVLTLGITAVEGQDLKKFMKKRKESAKETTSDRLGREADKKVSSEINKGLDKLFGSDEETDQTGSNPSGSSSSNSSSSASSSGNSGNSGAQIGMNALMRGMGMSSDVNVKERYNFDSYIEMTITNYDADGEKEEAAVYETYLDSDSFDYGLQFRDADQQGTSMMIFDTENNLMVTLVDSDGEKTGFAVGFDQEQIAGIAEAYEESEEEALDEAGAEEAEDADYNPYNLQKTGKTKTISGYKCEEYQYEDDESLVSIWATDDLDRDVRKSYLTNNNFAGMFFYAYYMDGFVMEYDVLDKSDNDRMVMTVTDVDPKRNTTFNTGSYNIMSMGAFQEEPEEE